jgi:molybdate transport system regulatory protein
MTDKSPTSPTIRVHIWLETDEGVFFGAGRVLLLEKIDIHGSLKKAAECLGMSYRAAWGKIKATEANVGFSLVKKNAGKKGGYSLTDDGRRLMAQYKSWFCRVEDSAVQLANEIFPFPVRPFKEP